MPHGDMNLPTKVFAHARICFYVFFAAVRFPHLLKYIFIPFLFF